jgi:septal ring factor EnvC (AmiA/AmiB activator)
MEANQAKAEADRKTNQAKMEAGHKELLATMEAKLLATMEADREERRVGQERLRKEIETGREEMAAWRERMAAETRAIKARTEAMQRGIGPSHMEMVPALKPEIKEETMACRESTETRLEVEKPTSPDRKP